MSGFFPRLTPTGVHVASGHDVIDVDAIPIAPLEGDQFAHGTNPIWLTASEIILERNVILYTYNRPKHEYDGRLMRAARPAYIPEIIGQSGNELAAAGGRWCVYEAPPIGPRLRFDDGVVWAGFSRPAWNDDGRLFACTVQADGLLLAGVPQAMGPISLPTGMPAVGCTNPTWRSGMLTFEVGARIYAWQDGDASATDITLGAWEAKPVAIQTPTGWWLLSHDQTRVMLRPWGSTHGIVVHDGPTDGPHDARWNRHTGQIRVVYSVGGILQDRSFDRNAPRVDLLADPWALAADGTPVEDCFDLLFGTAPVWAPGSTRDDCTIVIHKNGVHPTDQHEWRRVLPSAPVDVLHWYDASRDHDDVGWYLIPDPIGVYAKRTFRSGDRFGPFIGEIVDVDAGNVRKYWQHMLACYALAQGGVMFEIDPRPAPNLYGDGWGYEKFFNAPGRVRWELWCTELSPDGSTYERLLQTAEDVVGPGVPGPYVECPRPATPPDPPPDPEDPDVPVYLPNDIQMVNTLGRIHVEGYLGHLQRARGIFDAPNGAVGTDIKDPTRGEVFIDDDSISVWTGRYFTYFQQFAGDHERAIRQVLEDIYNSDEARQKRGELPPPPTTIAGPIQITGRTFADDRGPYFPLGASALYALADGRDPRALFDQYAAEGIEWVRVFGGYLDGRGQTAASARARFPQVLSWAHERGLRVQLDPVTDSAYGTYDVWEHVYLSALLGADVMTLVNEVGHDTQRDFSRQELLELRDHARAAGFTGPIALGAPVDLDELPEPGVDFPLAGGDYIPVHLARGKTPWYREGCRVKEQWEISRHHGVPTLNEEENRVEDTGYPVGFAYLTAILPRGFGGGTLFHSAQAREATAALSGVQLDALRAFVRGQNVLRDSRGPLTFYNARAAGSPVGTAAFVEPIPGDPEGETVWRCYSFVAGNEGMVVICGPNPDDPRIVWANGWEQRGVLDRVPVGGSTPAEGGGVTVLYIGR